MALRELVRTNDPVLLSYVEALLRDSGIDHLVMDRHMSILEGSIGIIPVRLMVSDDRLDQARRLLRDAGLGAQLAGTETP